MHFIRFLHVLLGVTLSGLFLANYFYLSLSLQEGKAKLLAFTLKRSLLSDCIFFFPAISLLFATGSYQVLRNNFSFSTPWIISAYVFFLLVTICWVIVFFLKSFNYVFCEQRAGKFFGKKIFHICYLLIFIFLILIIHDAIRKMTFIPWGRLLQ